MGKEALLMVGAALIQQYFNPKFMTLSYGSDLRHLFLGKRRVKALLLNFVCRTVMRRKCQSYAWREFVVPSGIHTAVQKVSVVQSSASFTS